MMSSNDNGKASSKGKNPLQGMDFGALTGAIGFLLAGVGIARAAGGNADATLPQFPTVSQGVDGRFTKIRSGETLLIGNPTSVDVTGKKVIITALRYEDPTGKTRPVIGKDGKQGREKEIDVDAATLIYKLGSPDDHLTVEDIPAGAKGLQFIGTNLPDGPFKAREILLPPPPSSTATPIPPPSSSPLPVNSDAATANAYKLALRQVDQNTHQPATSFEKLAVAEFSRWGFTTVHFSAPVFSRQAP